MKSCSKKVGVLSILLLVVFAVNILSYHAVDNSLSADDKRYIPMYLHDVRPLSNNPTYQDELKFIVSIFLIFLPLTYVPFVDPKSFI